MHKKPKQTLSTKPHWVDWFADGELNTSYFEIYKSIDGVHFSSIGTVKANNNSGMHGYEFVDNQITSGEIYYYYIKIKIIKFFLIINNDCICIYRSKQML